MAAANGGEAAAPTVVVAVVSWNTRVLLDRCLRSLAPSVRAGIAEVWVVDNGSSDGSVDLVRERHGWAHVVVPEHNLGYGRAVNLVAARTSSPWLAMANADVALREDAMERLLVAAESDPRAGAVAPRLILPDGSTQHSVWAFPTLAATLVQNVGSRFTPGRLAEEFALRAAWNPDCPRRVPWAIGAFLLVRRAAWNDVGGFDSEQWMSAEDLDLGWRLHRAGWETRYEPHALVDHEESAATAQVWGDELAIHWQRCAYAWMVRRVGRPRTVLVGAMNFLGSGARYLRGLLRRRFRPDSALHALGRWTLVHAYAVAPRRVLERYR